MAQITGLDDWILPETFLPEKLTVQVIVNFSNNIESLRLIENPKQRHKQSRKNRKVALRAFINQFAIENFEIIGLHHAIKFDSTLALAEQMKDFTGVERIGVLKIYSAQKKTADPVINYFCLKVLFIVQLEGYIKGLQLTDEQFVLIKATSFEDAQQRIKPHIDAYAKPYMNCDGEWVRWKFDQILDYNQITVAADSDLQTEATEIFSSSERRRMKPGDFWDGKW